MENSAWKMLLCSVTCGGQPKRSQLEIRFLFSNCTIFLSPVMLLVEESFLGTRVWGQAWCLRAAFTFVFSSQLWKQKKETDEDGIPFTPTMSWMCGRLYRKLHMFLHIQLILNPVMAFGCKWADAIFPTSEFEKTERQQSKVQCSCSWSKTEQDRNSQLLLHWRAGLTWAFSAATGCTGPEPGPSFFGWAVGLSIGWLDI